MADHSVKQSGSSIMQPQTRRAPSTLVVSRTSSELFGGETDKSISHSGARAAGDLLVGVATPLGISDWQAMLCLRCFEARTIRPLLNRVDVHTAGILRRLDQGLEGSSKEQWCTSCTTATRRALGESFRVPAGQSRSLSVGNPSNIRVCRAACGDRSWRTLCW